MGEGKGTCFVPFLVASPLYFNVIGVKPPSARVGSKANIFCLYDILVFVVYAFGIDVFVKVSPLAEVLHYSESTVGKATSISEEPFT